MKCSSLSLGLFCGIAATALWLTADVFTAFVCNARLQYVWIGDSVKLQSKRDRIVKGGAKNLHVIADFDRTLTKCFIAPGVRGVSAHGALERSPHLPSAYHEKARALFEKYHPLETTPELTIEQKIPLMKDWYRQGHALLIDQRFRREYITEAVRTAPMHMREGAKEMMRTLARAEVPLLVLSAGLGDVLEEVLKQKCGPLPPTTHVISNRMVFNDDGLLVGFSEPLIHMFNKHETHSADAPYYQAVHNRRNVILLGDGLGDLDMAEGVDTDTIITVGFLNARVGELWDRYIEAFDVVVVDDGDMSYVNDLLRDILAGGNRR